MKETMVKLTDDDLMKVSGGADRGEKESDVVTSFYCPVCGKEVRLKRPKMLFKARQEHMKEAHRR